MKKQPEHNRKNVPPQDTAKAPKSAVSRSMRTRAIVLAALFVLVGFGAVVYNLYQLQIVQHDELAARAENQQLADETITPNRGVIYDSDMKVLARSNKVWTVVASPRDMAKSGTNINDVAVKLAELLELDAQSILEKLQKSESNYQLIKRQIEKPVADAITAWITEYNASDKGEDTPVAGISLVQDAKRYYPYQTLASTIIGFVNADGDGVLGIESYYNDTLKGTAGRVVGMKNAWGYDLPNGTYEAAYDAEDGNGPGADAERQHPEHIGKIPAERRGPVSCGKPRGGHRDGREHGGDPGHGDDAGLQPAGPLHHCGRGAGGTDRGHCG